MQVSHSCFKYSWHLTLFPPKSSAQKRACCASLKTSFNDLKTSMLLPNQPIDPLISQPLPCPSRALRLSHVAVVHMLPLVVQPCKSRDGGVSKKKTRDSEYDYIIYHNRDVKCHFLYVKHCFVDPYIEQIHLHIYT